MQQYYRVSVAGAVGCGKTTLARAIATAMGLPHVELDALKFEVRWAFANWDVIPGNPTAYVEWEQAQGGDYDTIESKLRFLGPP